VGARVRREWSAEELIDSWTLLEDDRRLLRNNKSGASRVGFSLLLKFYGRHGRFPRGRGELPDEAVAYVGRQVGVPAGELGFYQWEGRTFEYHRSQVRRYFGFRECTVADADKLTAWLAEGVCQRERRVERVGEELAERCRREGIEPATVGRAGRLIGSALRQAEATLTARVVSRIPAGVAAAMTALIAEAPEHDEVVAPRDELVAGQAVELVRGPGDERLVGLFHHPVTVPQPGTGRRGEPGRQAGRTAVASAGSAVATSCSSMRTCSATSSGAMAIRTAAK